MISVLNETSLTTRLLDQLYWSSDFPFHVTREEISPTLIIILLVALAYAYGSIYILYVKYFYPSLEDVMHTFERTTYAPYLTIILTCIPFLFLMFFSCFFTRDNLGIATIVGSDAINLLLVMGLIQFRVAYAYRVDPWAFAKDSFFYTLNLSGLMICYSKENLTWSYAFGWFIFFLIYACFFQVSEGWFKDKFYEIFGVESDRDGFSCDEMKTWERRRYSITELIDEGYLDERTETELDDEKILYFPLSPYRLHELEHEKPGISAVIPRWKRPTAKIVNAIRKRVSFQRDQVGGILMSKRLERKQLLGQLQNSSPTPSQMQLLQIPSSSSNTNLPISPSASNKSIQKFSIAVIPEEAPKTEMGSIFDTDGKELQSKKDIQDDLDREIREEEPEDREDSFMRHEKEEKKSNLKFHAVHYDEDGLSSAFRSRDRTPINARKNQHHLDVSIEEDNEYNLTLPYKFNERIRFVLFFPIFFVLYFMIPSFRRQLSPRKSLISTIFILVILAGVIFLAMCLLEIIAYAWDINIEVLGLTLNSLALCLGRIMYYSKGETSLKGTSFISTFQTTGLYRYGLCGGVSWLVYAIFNGDTFPRNKEGFLFTGILLSVLVVGSFILIACNRMRVVKYMRPYFMVSYLVFFVFSIIFMTATGNNI